MTAIDIVGGGLLGLMLAYELGSRRVPVRVWERGAQLGGCAGLVCLNELGGLAVDRRPHLFQPENPALLRLLNSLGLEHTARSAAPQVGCYYEQRLFALARPSDLLRFTPLSPLDRGRLALTLRALRVVGDWRELEGQTAVDWLRSHGGSTLLEQFWLPLLAASLDTDSECVPASYLWARMQQQGSLAGRSSDRKELGALAGGTAGLVAALSSAIEAQGGEICLKSVVEHVQLARDHVAGLVVNGFTLASNGAVLTMPPALAQHLLPPAAAAASGMQESSGAVDTLWMLLVLRNPLMPFSVLTVVDRQLPFGTLLQPTSITGPSDGYELLYIPKEILPESIFSSMDSSVLQHVLLGFVRQMFPNLQSEAIAAVRFTRDRCGWPLPTGGTNSLGPALLSNLGGLFYANTTQIYPHKDDLGAIAAYASSAAEQIAARHGAGGHERAIAA